MYKLVESALTALEFETKMNRLANTSFLAVALIWAGMIVGVSFIATPVKFTAASLTLPVALEVGRVTFALLARIEWVAMALVLIAATAAGWTLSRAVLAGAVALILLAQALWLLPVLDARVSSIIAGAGVAESHHHLTFALIEALKAIVLVALAFCTPRRTPYCAELEKQK
jgi:hypothetical protein